MKMERETTNWTLAFPLSLFPDPMRCKQTTLEMPATMPSPTATGSNCEPKYLFCSKVTFVKLLVTGMRKADDTMAKDYKRQNESLRVFGGCLMQL